MSPMASVPVHSAASGVLPGHACVRIETKFDNREAVILGMPCDKPLQPFEQIVGAARLRSEILTNLRRPGCPDIQYGNLAANGLKMCAGIFAPAHRRRRGVPFLVLAAVML